MSAALASLDTPTGDISEAVATLDAAELALDSPDVDAVAAWQWSRDVQALIRLRKAAADILGKAKRVEAKALRRIGQLDDKAIGNPHRGAARYLASLTDAEFADFLAAMHSATGTVLGDIRDYKREQVQAAWRDERRRYAESGEAGDYTPQQSVSQAAGQVIESALRESEQVPTADAIDVLADDLGLDPSDDVIRKGLNALIVRAASESGDDFGWTHWTGNDSPTVGECGRIPRSVTFKDDTGAWIRSAWKHASLRQLAFNVQMVEDQAAERAEAAKGMRALYEQLLAVVRLGHLSDLDHTTRAADVLHLGRINGLIAAHVDGAPKHVSERFPKWWDYASGHGGMSAIERGAQVLAEHDVLDESELDEAKAEALAPRLFTGKNRMSMEWFADAYAPNLRGTFALAPWEIPAILRREFEERAS